MLAYVASRHAIAAFLSPPTVHFVDPDSLATTDPPLASHPTVGVACAISAGPGYIASTSSIGTIEIFNVQDGASVASVVLGGHVQAMRYSAATGTLAVGFRDGSIQACDFPALLAAKPATGRHICAHNDRAESLDFSPDGKWLVSGGRDGAIKLWRGSTLHDTIDVLLDAALWTWNSLLAAAGLWSPRRGMLDRGACICWMHGMAIDNGLRLLPYRPMPSGAPIKGFSTLRTTGDEIAVAENSHIHTIDTRTGERKAEFVIPTNTSPASVGYSPDGRLLTVRWPYAEALVLDRDTGADRIDSRIRRGMVWVRSARFLVILCWILCHRTVCGCVRCLPVNLLRP